ncbi:MAG: HU family DNA-binding protein [Deltaproteobacteria bacterium]|nr:HU family DNA-binding protein [Deltaproteobacteria bacterium]
MRKAELIDRIVKGAGLSRKKAALALDALLVAVRGSLAGNEALRIPGLGTFKVAQRKARKGINPRTGRTMSIPAARVPKFVAAKTLKESVSDGKGVSRPEADHSSGPACDDISDPIRRAMCKVCGIPVLSGLPFCSEHQPPVP